MSDSDKFGMILYQKVERNGSFGFEPEFKRVTAAEYDEYKKQFQDDINKYRQDLHRDAINPEHSIFNRVIDTSFLTRHNNKRKLQDRDNNEASPKRRRLNGYRRSG